MAKQQLKIAGTERQDINPALEKAAKKYKTARDERMELTEQETKAKAGLMAAMNEAKLPKDEAGVMRYLCDFDDQEVVLEPGEDNVKMKTRKVAKPEDGNETEGNKQ